MRRRMPSHPFLRNMPKSRCVRKKASAPNMLKERSLYAQDFVNRRGGRGSHLDQPWAEAPGTRLHIRQAATKSDNEHGLKRHIPN